jgi:hypothetical protein
LDIGINQLLTQNYDGDERQTRAVLTIFSDMDFTE